MEKIFSASMLILLPFSAFASAEPQVPEPGTLGLLALGVGAAIFVAKRRGRRK